MSRMPALSALAAGSLMVGLALAPAAAAAEAPGADYGQHVRECARSMGFDADHNPGMHQGITRWDPAQEG